MKALAAFLLLLVSFACCTTADKGTSAAMERNEAAYRMRYTDVDASLQAAKEAYEAPSATSDDKAEALNNMAYVSYQQMRYDHALQLLQDVRAASRNQLELLCADVLTMKVMQRIGRGKAFFDARLRAEKHLRRILSEESSLTQRQKHRLHYAQTELHIVASTYYYYLGQDSLARHEIEEASEIVNLEADTTQWLYYQYMMGSGGLVEGQPEDVTVTEFNHLFRAYTLAKANHFTYFEANALQSLSAIVSDSLRASWVKQQRSDAYSFLLGEHQQWCADSVLPPRLQFAAAMSRHAISLFRQYRDVFQTACAMRTLGEVYFAAEHYDEALGSFLDALHLASDNTRSPYQVTPWLASIHENLSLTYSALGDKPSADSHRNQYLDLLDQSRQNRELDSRKALLGQEARSELLQFGLLLLLIGIVAVLSVVYYRQLNHRSRSFEGRIRQIRSSEDCIEAEEKLSELVGQSAERREESKEECDALAQQITQQRQRHIIGRAKLSAIYAIIPYLDRAISEVKKLGDNDGNAAERLTYIQELCSGMMGINDRLTAWIQMQQGRVKLQVTRFPLSDVLQVIAMQQAAFAKQQLQLIVPDTQLWVKADRALTLFMVNTLVDNARKFTLQGGTVAVELCHDDKSVRVMIKDTGVGLPEEDVRVLNDSKIYDPNRIGAKNASKGFGFGIMNCKGIIGSYRKLSSLFDVCDFGVESTEGKGSCFWFRLPRVLTLLLLVLHLTVATAMPQRCYELYDSTFAANLGGRFEDACRFAEEAIAEAGAPTDTSLLVSLYNEQAIAAQAIGQWDVYRRANAECVRLHRLYSSDHSLAYDCQRLEKMTADSRVLYVLIVLLFIVSLVLFYMIVLRHRLRHRASMDELCQRLTSTLHAFPENKAVFDDELRQVCDSLKQPSLRKMVEELRQHFAEGLATLQATDADTEELDDRIKRLRFEHDRIYVMNQVLDNSLSTIKHETMYFPSRIKQMAETLSDALLNQGTDEQEVAHLREDLEQSATYYRHIYMLLYEQAGSQTDQSLLRLRPVEVSRLADYATSLGITCQPADIKVKGDVMQLMLLLSQIHAASSAKTILCFEQNNSMCYFKYSIVSDPLPAETLQSLFSPQTERLEYLVAREIIREHDAALGHPGLRLEAVNTEQGYDIIFSLPTYT